MEGSHWQWIFPLSWNSLLGLPPPKTLLSKSWGSSLTPCSGRMMWPWEEGNLVQLSPSFFCSSGKGIEEVFLKCKANEEVYFATPPFPPSSLCARLLFDHRGSLVLSWCLCWRAGCCREALWQTEKGGGIFRHQCLLFVFPRTPT